jgi:prepilin-type N-terminal cleavage/methylation domain-containing protein
MQRGFTLLELSIVLAIIGLIAGGIVVGQGMIRSAEIKMLVTEVNEINTAVNTFKIKYNSTPGDFDKATKLWGASHATLSTCLNTVGTGTQTCDGDGNGVLTRTGRREMFLFWKHLSNANMISGVYTGITGPNGPFHDTTDNAFNSKLGRNTIILATNLDRDISASTDWFDGPYYKNFLQIGAPDPLDGASPSIAVLSPLETYHIDKKVDDGKPATGTWRTRSLNTCTDPADSTDLDADYLLSEDRPTCKVIVYDTF